MNLQHQITSAADGRSKPSDPGPRLEEASNEVVLEDAGNAPARAAPRLAAGPWQAG